MYIKRLNQIARHLNEKSILLLGPRRTGKSSFIKYQLKPDLYFNLLETKMFAQFSYDPGLLSKLIKKNHKIVCIDEIQKLPNLMNEVHSIIENNKNVKFLLTGSSAKKIKSSHTSLMAGRARQLSFFPFTYNEVKNKKFNLHKFLLFGGLPEVYLSKNPWEELKDYAGLYLTEEIQSSAFVRKIENYSRFLEFAAHSSGQILNFEKLSRDAYIPARTIKDYYQLLEETLIGYNLPSFRPQESRKEVSTSKFYFFDTGILNALIKRNSLKEKTPTYGELFEHFIFIHLKTYQLQQRADWKLEFWRTHKGEEVDFILNKGLITIETKATNKIKPDHLIGLKKFKELYTNQRSLLVCQVDKKFEINGVEIYPWTLFLDELFSGKIIQDKI